ncbi:hypothetical protein [Cytophaga hutchinsonii]|jgi:hypothetical protein|uniref:Uncharacterized protein n=1 Tax=Cytophaga hutchinsonii (strain ATCC 33406 / DSM 1761 / CIP 103989 / NBRC 15051 / NCIMB 9469 / D465) TaxID=269798 RepID=A0A6N4SPX1_CYTH3|nr:hypothetical protein [Cytophaga hutchinsonii]ABG58370.1 hypothetical protein CHU_1093 [Cytophaga hutchinsonii ATCC 33406]SFX51545.1 hypothetical protein SAMN04487930_10560 [Cytophaga hutchinsonii ATCC 33406]
MKTQNNKEPKKPAATKDKLENKDQKNTDKKAASQNDIGMHEFDEDLTTEIRMTPQPFDKAKPVIRDNETDGL